jgi:arylformamidase
VNTIDREFSPSLLVPDLGRYLDEYRTRSSRALACRRVHTDLRYGPGPAERLDLFPTPAPDAPLQVFVHGGFWQELGKPFASFVAADFLDRGVAFAALGYGLAPVYRLDEIVAMVRRAVWWLARNAPRFGVDPARIHLSGSSAGAHLAAMALLPGWVPDGRAPADLIAGVTLLSGVYDLAPLLGSYVNDALALTEADVRRNSPLGRLPSRLPPTVIARGEIETDEFVRQHSALVAAFPGRAVEVVAAGRNHFDLPYDLADPDTALGTAVLAQLGR